MGPLFVGLMSGTSLDGVDGVLAEISPDGLRVLAHGFRSMPADLRNELLRLNTPGADELHRAALAANALMREYAAVVHEVLALAEVEPGAVSAIGAHGQTVRHRPQAFDGTGYTLQLCQPALLAELTGIAVCADFRSRDVAAGGQGAPLAPFFHRAWLGAHGRTVGVLNIGGISNLSLLRGDGSLLGFDCGPGNALMDGWCEHHLGEPFDREGAWASGGRVAPHLLDDLLADPYFSLPPPKSTGRDLFHRGWLDTHLARHAGLTPQDVQATLAELTARCCAQEVARHEAGLSELVVCGGGALNVHLMSRLAQHLPGATVQSSAARGLPPLQVEAAAFAWLAARTLAGEALDLKSTTGARGARVLGCVYPA
jgi:anhydro-N-acetylmuramic acid kinase